MPPKDTLTTLQPKKTREHGPDDLPEFRHADLAAKGAASIWKLYYNGSVGGQAIVGIPAARRLRDARGDAAWVLAVRDRLQGPDRGRPGRRAGGDRRGLPLAGQGAVPAPGEVKDAAQVRALAEHFAKLDEAGQAGRPVRAEQDRAPEDVVADAETQEGWILGAAI